MPAVHPGPHGDRVVRQVLLVDVAVAGDELGRADDLLADGQVGQPQPDERVQPGALLGVDVDVREVGRVGERDAADVVASPIGIAHGMPASSNSCGQSWGV